jgi:predicted CXXCH cytochrome family protein
MFDKYPCLRLIVLAVSGATLLAGTCRGDEQCLPPPTTNAQCLECHGEMVNEALAKTFVHQPFRENKCMTCHLGGELFVPTGSAYASDPLITWLAKSPTQSVEHWLTIPNNRIAGGIRLDIRVPGHDVYRSVIEDTDLTDLPEMTMDRTPPQLSDVRIDSIEKGVLLTATVSWTTDELADTRIAYGIDRRNKTAYQAEMSRTHRITIADLREGTEYQFQVASADYLGNLAEAEIGTFSTSAIGLVADRQLTAPPKTEMTWDRQIYRDSRTGQVILKVTTSVPTDVAVGMVPNSSPEQSLSRSPSGRRKPCRHQLKTALETTIAICQPCHDSYFKGANLHPLEVGPQPGMAFPPDLFLLANGGINCATCHQTHSSNNPTLLVKSDKNELCLSCHKNKH